MSHYDNPLISSAMSKLGFVNTGLSYYHINQNVVVTHSGRTIIQAWVVEVNGKPVRDRRDRYDLTFASAEAAGRHGLGLYRKHR